MNKRRRSPIWKLSKEEFKDVVDNSTSISDALKYFGLSNKGGNYKTFKIRLKEDQIDFSHFKISKKIRKFNNSLNEILVINSFYNRSSLKKRLLAEELLENKCYVCGLNPEWNLKPLVLQLDHINGISNDNRLENLRMICPNCHSQTDNFAGKNIKYSTSNKKEVKIKDPNWRNRPQFSTRKVQRPSKDELAKLLWEKPTLQISKDFGVSDKSVEKWAKSYGLNKPPRGYWQKIKKV